MRKQELDLSQEESIELDTLIENHPLLAMADDIHDSGEEHSNLTPILTVQVSKSKKKPKTIAGQMELFDLLFSA